MLVCVVIGYVAEALEEKFWKKKALCPLYLLLPLLRGVFQLRAVWMSSSERSR